MQRMGPLLCFWTGGIRRAEQKMPQCGIFPPRGERARDCAARSASRPPPVRRIPPSCGNRRGGAMRRMGPLLCFWTGGIRRAEQKMPQCGIFPPRGAMARSCAAWKANSKRPARRIPPFCGNRRGGPMQRMGPLLCFWTGGIRRAEQKMPQCGIFPPRGERARDCAARSASRPPPVRRIPPSCGNRRGGPMQRMGPLLCFWTGGIRRAEQKMPQCGIFPPRGERAREQIRPAGGCPAGAARRARAAAPCTQTSVSPPANPLRFPRHIISGVTCKSTREPSTAFTAMKSRSGSPSPRSSS